MARFICWRCRGCIALNALNTVQKIKAMSKMSEIDQIHLRAVMLCYVCRRCWGCIALNALNTVQKIKAMSKMSKIDQIHLRAVMLCMSETSKMGKEHTQTFWLITSLILNGFSIRKKVLRKLWARMCVYVLFPSSTSPTYIALQPLGVFDLSSTSSTLLWSFVQYSMHSMLCISTPPTSNNVHWHILARAL